MPLCEIRGLAKSFGGLMAIQGINLDVLEGEILSVIGPNGAGKTTLFNVITGFYAPSAGTVKFRNRDITGWKAHQISRIHIARTFQLVKVIKKLSVLENALLGSVYYAGSLEEARAEAARWLEFTGLGKKKNLPIENLTHADNKRLEIARALATRPELLLLDEPLGGLNHTEVLDACDMIRKIREMGVTIVMVEHVMKGVMSLSQRIAVINYGQKIAEGTPSEISTSAEVIKAYLGKAYVENRRE